MKRWIVVGVLALAGVAGMAQTCRLTNESLTTIDDHDTFAGELENGSGVDILHHRFRVAFLNSNGAVVESMTVDGCLRSLQDGTSNFFAAASTQPDETTTGALGRMANLAEDPAFEVGVVEDGDIAIADVTAERDGETLTVTGTITNNDDDDLEEPAVCVVVWNDDGRVVTVAKEDGFDDLAEGASVDFDIDITVPDDEDLVDLVDVWADGLEDDVPVEPASEAGVTVDDSGSGTPVPTSTSVPATATPAP